MMKSRIFIAIVLLFAGIMTQAQDNFSYTPAKPQPGDVIKFSYTTSGDLAGNNKPLEAFVLSMNTKGNNISDIKVARNAGKWEGEFKTDTSAKLVAFGFKIDKDFDNNKNLGYVIQMYNGDKVVQQSNYAAFELNQFYPDYVGMKNDADRAFNFLEAEKKLYPANFNEKYLNSYLGALLAKDKTAGTAAIQKEIENTFKVGLDNEANLNKLTGYYSLLRLQQQLNYFNKLKAEKFPSKTKDVMGYYNEYRSAKDLDQKLAVYNTFLGDNALKNSASDYDMFSQYLTTQIANAYIADDNFKGFEAFASKIADKSAVANLYNSAAWDLYKKDKDLKLAESLAKQAVTIAKANMLKPTGTKPSLLTAKQWAEERATTYASNADTYAAILYKLGKYKAAFPFAKDAAFTYNNGDNAGINSTYANIAEKVLPAAKYKADLESFVKSGKADASIVEKLKNLFIKQGGTEQSFDGYLSNLEKEATLKLIEEIKAGMISTAAPKFSLKNLDGTTVSLESLKGKTVIADFWATWCGPCKASFPAMQKMVNKYKNDPSVKFVFVNTWENVENKHKNAQDFIKSMNYSFDVLLDSEDVMAKSFQAAFPEFTGIPTKFFIDKNGTVRYMSVGFGGEDKTMKEVDAIIEILK